MLNEEVCGVGSTFPVSGINRGHDYYTVQSSIGSLIIARRSEGRPPRVILPFTANLFLYFARARFSFVAFEKYYTEIIKEKKKKKEHSP